MKQLHSLSEAEGSAPTYIRNLSRTKPEDAPIAAHSSLRATGLHPAHLDFQIQLLVGLDEIHMGCPARNKAFQTECRVNIPLD